MNCPCFPLLSVRRAFGCLSCHCQTVHSSYDTVFWIIPSIICLHFKIVLIVFPANFLNRMFSALYFFATVFVLFVFNIFRRSLSVPLLYHSMGQIIKSVFFVCVCMCVCMYVCMYVCVCVSVGTLTVAFFNRSSRNLVRTFGVWIGRTD